jgi:hypothetical protein
MQNTLERPHLLDKDEIKKPPAEWGGRLLLIKGPKSSFRSLVTSPSDMPSGNSHLLS